MTDNEKQELLEIEVAVLREANQRITQECEKWRKRYYRLSGHPAARREMFGELDEISDNDDD